MKTILASLLALLVVSISVVSAQPSPFPVVVQVADYYKVGIDVTVKFMATGTSVVLKTNEDGEAAIDWGSTGDSHPTIYPADKQVFAVTVNSKTTYGYIRQGQLDLVRIDERDAGESKLISCESNLDSCMSKAFPSPEPCQSQTPTYTPSPTPMSCPRPEPYIPEGESGIQLAVSFLLGAVAYVGIGTAVKIYKGKDGKAKVTHMHPTVLGYHDVNIIHRKQPHKKGEIYPEYKKNAEGEWKYIKK